MATVESCALFFSERRDARLAKLCVRHGAMNLWFMVMVARTRALAICQTFCRSFHTCGFANVSKHLFGSNSRSIDCVRRLSNAPFHVLSPSSNPLTAPCTWLGGFATRTHLGAFGTTRQGKRVRQLPPAAGRSGKRAIAFDALHAGVVGPICPSIQAFPRTCQLRPLQSLATSLAHDFPTSPGPKRA